MTDGVNSRELVLEMLLEINENGSYSHLVLRDVLSKYQYLQKQDRAFITRLTEGTIERLIELDYIIDQFSRTKVRKMKPLIRNLLRMSVYQIMYMDKVPDAATCNEAVKIAKRHKFQQLSGFVNGVLRNISRNKNTIKYPDEQSNPGRYLEIKYSMPVWIVDKWTRDYGYEKTREILEGFQKENKLSIRTNKSACTPEELKERLISEGVTVESVNTKTPIDEYAFYISDYDYLEALDSFNDGLFYVQDISSMLVAQIADVKKDDYVIDVCAAPGGKSTHIAELLGNTGMVDARDLTEYKVGLIEDNIARTGLANIKAKVWDATVLDEQSVGKADVLICDLPCSGLGVLGKKTDIRYKITEQSLTSLSELQHKILDTVYTYVKDTGILVYSTCTINKIENEKTAEWFTTKYPQFKLVSMKQMYPKETGNDGFFIAKFQNTGV